MAGLKAGLVVKSLNPLASFAIALVAAAVFSAKFSIASDKSVTVSSSLKMSKASIKPSPIILVASPELFLTHPSCLHKYLT
jgi:hypothetical protein